jgi:rfaE bifunctional protein nucleotidyltransferase chain/domain
MLRLNSPWYTKEELEHIFLTEKLPKYVDINIKPRSKPKKADHDYKFLLKLCGKYNIDWVAISNVESADLHVEIRKLLSNDKTKICAKIESSLGCKNVENIMDKFDGIMVDTEDLAMDTNWEQAIKERDRIYKACKEKQKDYFQLTGVIFEHIKPSTIVYSYGAFDLLHPGHIKLLERAKSYGTFLIVGIVKDEAIKKLKGNDRPIQPFQDRLDIIKSLKCVDVAIAQEDYNPVPNLEIFIPDILVKGDDWDYIPGEDWVKKNNKKLIKPTYSKGWSTSGMVKKIRGEQ